MLKLTEAFDLTFLIPDAEENEGKINVVPCLLPEKEPVGVRIYYNVTRTLQVASEFFFFVIET